MCLAPNRKDEVEMDPSDRTSAASVVRPKAEQSPQEPGGANKLYLIAAILTWLVTGTSISSLNKWIFAVYNFKYPLFLSSLHMLTAILLDYPILRFGLIHVNTEEELTLTTGARFKVFLLSVTFCSSIAFGNLGLSCVQLSFAQMIYTTTPIFTLALSKLFLGTKHHALKYTAMIPICLGACFSIIGEVQFDRTGCIYLFASTFLRGLKSIQQSFLLKNENIHSVTLLYLMSIPSFCILLLAAVLLEWGVVWESPPDCDNRLWLFILLSCLGSVLYNLASFCVITLTSAVTIHVLGNLNVIGNLVLSRVVFGSHLTFLSYMGIGLTLAGMFMYHNCEFIAGYIGSRRSLHATERRVKSD